MSDNFLLLTFIYLVLEFYEIQWQRAESMMGMLLRMFQHYKKSPLLFFAMHPTYYYVIFLLLAMDEHTVLLIMLFIKTVDIAAKVLLIQQVFEKRELSHEMSLMLLTPLHPLMPYIGMLIYPPFIYMAFYM
ncbi:MAG: hypothetical protein U9N52_00630 [Campylobacterota bacterium]|nr:hypothetical protein [Campylobacterota bacterium]